MRDHRISTTLGTLAVREMGEGPATMLWPSLYVDHESLVPIATELARTRRCILVDGPGHGRSAVPARRYTLWDCVEAAEQVLEALGAPVVDWIGNAWGGHVGICAAARSPARVRTLTVIGSPIHALPGAMRFKSQAVLALLALGAGDLVGKLVAKAMVSPRAAPEHLDYVRRCVRDAPAGGVRLAVQSISLGRPDLTPELPRVTAPTLFIAGSDDAIWPPEAARRDAAAIAGAHCEIVADAAHLPPLERPRETLQAVTGFLAAAAPH